MPISNGVSTPGVFVLCPTRPLLSSQVNTPQSKPASTNSTLLVLSRDNQHQDVCSSQRCPGVSQPSILLSQVTHVIDRIVPIHEQALLDRLSKYNKKLRSIDRRIPFATPSPRNSTIPSIPKRHGTKRPHKSRTDRSLGAVTADSRVTKTRAVRKRLGKQRQSGDQTDESQRKLRLQVKEMTSALCDVYMILTHLVGIEMTPNIGVRRQAEGLEDNAFLTVVCLTDMYLALDEESYIFKMSSEFEDVFKCVSMILLRNGNGPNSESQDQRRKLLEKLNPGCDELIQTLETLSIKQEAVENEARIDLV